MKNGPWLSLRFSNLFSVTSRNILLTKIPIAAIFLYTYRENEKAFTVLMRK